MELYSGVIDDFTEYLDTLSPAELSASATFDGKSISMKSVLSHVVNSGCYYAENLKHALRGKTPSFDLEPKLPADPLDSVRSLIPRTAEACEGFWAMTEAELARKTVMTSWKQTYSVDQLLEHAIVHILWHKRQCKRIIAFASEHARTTIYFELRRKDG
jgi:uncharacterized damage-inducible protein DinB